MFVAAMNLNNFPVGGLNASGRLAERGRNKKKSGFWREISCFVGLTDTYQLQIFETIELSYRYFF